VPNSRAGRLPTVGRTPLKVFGPKGEKAAGGCRKQYNEKFSQILLSRMLTRRSNQGGYNGRGNSTHGTEKMPINFGRKTCRDETIQKSEA
jgi:hypothetical protein